MIRTWHCACHWLAFFLPCSMALVVGTPPAGGSEDPRAGTIDQHIERVWKENGLKPSAPATDGEWCRRVYLDVLGRIPTVDELKAFLADRSSDKQVRLVHRLLDAEEYTEEYARNWTTIWSNLLIGRTGGTENNSLINRDGMQKYLRDSFARNKSYDRMVWELVTATGDDGARQ